MPDRRISVAAALSLLAHGLLAAIPISQRASERGVPDAPALVVQLVEKRPPAAELVAPVPVKPRPLPVKPALRPQPVPQPAPRPVPVPAEPLPAPVETAQRPPAPQFDMLAMINARRQRREALEDAMRQREEARSASAAQSPADAAAATINRNLQSLGSNGDTTGGVFTVLSKGTRTGEFAFNGFRPETNRRWREVIEVDAGPGGDVELAMVRRMIELIRSHYTGDFIWRSHRLGKSLVLSARPEDSAGLEDFLMREFFGTPTLGRAH